MFWSHTKHHSIYVLECSGSPIIIILFLSTLLGTLKRSPKLSKNAQLIDSVISLQTSRSHSGYNSVIWICSRHSKDIFAHTISEPFVSIVITKYEIVVLVLSHYI